MQHQSGSWGPLDLCLCGWKCSSYGFFLKLFSLAKGFLVLLHTCFKVTPQTSVYKNEALRRRVVASSCAPGPINLSKRKEGFSGCWNQEFLRLDANRQKELCPISLAGCGCCCCHLLGEVGPSFTLEASLNAHL